VRDRLRILSMSVGDAFCFRSPSVCFRSDVISLIQILFRDRPDATGYVPPGCEPPLHPNLKPYTLKLYTLTLHPPHSALNTTSSTFAARADVESRDGDVPIEYEIQVVDWIEVCPTKSHVPRLT